MTITIKVKKQDLDIKFDYRLMFKANKVLSSVDENGQRAENGAGQLFVNVLERKDSAIFDLIRLADTRKLTEEDIVDAIANYAAEHGYETIFEEVEAELLESGFFRPKIQKYLDDMKFGQELLGEPTNREETTQQKALEKMVERLQSKISSHNVQDTE